MITPLLPFRKGERVRVLCGPLQGEEGTVVQVDSIPTPDGSFEMVWVRLEREIEGFRPASLEAIEHP